MARKEEQSKWLHLSRELRERHRWNTLISEKQLTAITSLCCWIDIHAFTRDLAAANWVLATAQQQGLIQLLGYVYGKAAETSFSLKNRERILVLNDGVARAMDLNPPIAPTVLAEYLHKLLLHHYIMVDSLQSSGRAIRTILAGGERMQYASEISPLIYNPAQFQMNTAFARAFIVGESEEVEENRIYMEQNWISAINQEMSNCVALEENGTSGKIVILEDGHAVLTLLYDDKFPVEDNQYKDYMLTVFRLSRVESSSVLLEADSPFSLTNN